MTVPTTPLNGYLHYLQTYLLGDLKAFHEKCASCEKEENTQNKFEAIESPPTSSFGQGSYGKPPTTSTSTTSDSTKFPNISQGFPEPPMFFRSTIPHTLTLFATMDTLGFLMRDENDYTKTYKNFESFFNGLPNTEEEKKVLLNVCRHGMSHSYFPQLSLGISYHSAHAGESLFFINRSNDLILNVNELERVVITKLNSIVADHSAYPNMAAQFAFLENDYERRSRSFIDALKIQIQSV